MRERTRRILHTFSDITMRALSTALTALMGYCASLWQMIVKIHAMMTKRMKRRLTISFFYRNARGQTVKPGG